MTPEELKELACKQLPSIYIQCAVLTWAWVFWEITK